MYNRQVALGCPVPSTIFAGYCRPKTTERSRQAQSLNRRGRTNNLASLDHRSHGFFTNLPIFVRLFVEPRIIAPECFGGVRAWISLNLISAAPHWL